MRVLQLLIVMGVLAVSRTASAGLCEKPFSGEKFYFYLSISTFKTPRLGIPIEYIEDQKAARTQEQTLGSLVLPIEWPSMCPLPKARQPQTEDRSFQVATLQAGVFPHVANLWARQVKRFVPDGEIKDDLPRFRLNPTYPAAKWDTTQRYFYDGSNPLLPNPAIITCSSFCELYTESSGNIAISVMFAPASLDDWKAILKSYQDLVASLK